MLYLVQIVSNDPPSADYTLISTANFILSVERAALDMDTIRSDSEIRQLITIIDHQEEIISAAARTDENVGTIQGLTSRAETAATDAETSRDLADEALATVSDLMEGYTVPLCEVGTWNRASDSAGGWIVDKKNHGKKVRTADFLRFAYPVILEIGEGYQAAGYYRDGTYISPSTTRIAIPADTEFVLIITALVEPVELLVEEDVPEYARAVHILTKTAVEIDTAFTRLDTMASTVNALSAAEEVLADRMTSMLDGTFTTECEVGTWSLSSGEVVKKPNIHRVRTAGYITFSYDAVVEVGDGFRVSGYHENGTYIGWKTTPFTVPAGSCVCFNISLAGGDTADTLTEEDAVTYAAALRIFTRPAALATKASELTESLGTTVSAHTEAIGEIEETLENLTIQENQIEGHLARCRARFDDRFLSIAYSIVDDDPGRINTAAHFEYCGHQAGYAALKGDVAPTTDGLIMCHDAGYTLTDAGLIMTYNASNSVPWHSVTTAAATALRHVGTLDPIITLDEYLRICKKYGKIAFITIRDQYMSEVVPRLFEGLDKYRMRENCIVNSFTYTSLEAVRAVDDTVYLSRVLASSTILSNSIIDSTDALGVAMVSAFDYPDFGRESAFSDTVLAYARAKDVRVCESLLTTAEDIETVQRRGLAGAQMKLTG